MANDFLSIIQPATRSKRERPPKQRVLPVLPVRDTVLFPHAVLPLTVGRESSIHLIQSLGEEKTIVVVAQRDARLDTPNPADLHSVGTLATVHKVVKMPNQSLFVFTEGTERVQLGRVLSTEPFMTAEVRVDCRRSSLEHRRSSRHCSATSSRQFQPIVTVFADAFGRTCRPSR